MQEAKNNISDFTVMDAARLKSNIETEYKIVNDVRNKLKWGGY